MFSEAGKVVSKSEPYRTDDLEQDIAKWTEFYDCLKIWFLNYLTLIDYLEKNTNVPIGISTMDGSLVFRLHIYKEISNQNGFKAWRHFLA